MEKLNQLKLKKLPKRIRGTIRRSAKEILASDPKQNDPEEEEENEDAEEDLDMRIQRKILTPADTWDMWDALYKEEQEIEEILFLSLIHI